MKKAEKVAYWRQQVDAFEASGFTVKDYCTQAGIAVATLHDWRKRFAASSEQRSMAAVPEGFLPVTLARFGRLFRRWRFTCSPVAA